MNLLAAKMKIPHKITFSVHSFTSLTEIKIISSFEILNSCQNISNLLENLFL